MAERNAISYLRSDKGERVTVADDGTIAFPDGYKLVPPHVGVESAGGETRKAVSYLRSDKGERVKVSDDGTIAFPDGYKLVPPQAGENRQAE